MIEVHPHTGICFIKVAGITNLSTILKSTTALTVTDADLEKWFYLGSIYLDGKRQRQDCDVIAGQTIRLHTRPKHYVKQLPKLADKIVVDHPEFLILDKPAGLPTHATLDNYVENAKFILEQELKIPIYTTHRLDIHTEGLLTFAKSADAQRLINGVFAKGLVKKIYNATAEKELPAGQHVHYMDVSSRAPKVLCAIEMPGWRDCRLEILSCKQTPQGYLHKIQLHTGRTHQIRAQFSFMGAPIIGDHLYGSTAAWPNECIALECFSLTFPFPNRSHNRRTAPAMPIETVFPSYLYRGSMGAKGANSLTNELAREIKILSKIDKHGRKWSAENYQGGYSSYSSLTNLHITSPNFAELSVRLQPHVQKFAKQLKWNLMGRELRMTTCRANSMGRGTHHTMHNHPLCVVSGVYYVSVPAGSSPFKIEDPRQGLMMAAPPRKASAPPSEQNHLLIKPQTGQFLLFESWMRHEVPRTGATSTA